MSDVIGKKYQRLCPSRAEAGLPMFARGFMAGQAEKVHLGVCPACMFRPAEENLDWTLSDAREIAEVYGLEVAVLDSFCPQTPKEIWLHRKGFVIGEWLRQPLNSYSWHHYRAAACGIPLEDVDSGYHLRNGYGHVCE